MIPSNTEVEFALFALIPRSDDRVDAAKVASDTVVRKRFVIKDEGSRASHVDGGVIVCITLAVSVVTIALAVVLFALGYLTARFHLGDRLFRGFDFSLALSLAFQFQFR